MSKKLPFPAPKSKAYLLNDIPPELYAAAVAKAKETGVPLRSVFLAVLCAWVDGDITLTPGRRRRRSGRRPGRSVHIEQKGLRGEAVIQPHRFSARLKRPAPPAVAPPPPPPVAPPAPSGEALRTALAKLRERI